MKLLKVYIEGQEHKAQIANDGIFVRDSYSPFVGADGYWYIWDNSEQEYIKSVEAKGPKGDQGIQGPKGDKGNDSVGFFDFEIVDGDLIMTYTQEPLDLSINDDGYLILNL